jgi:hypothetical protein
MPVRLIAVPVPQVVAAGRRRKARAHLKNVTVHKLGTIWSELKNREDSSGVTFRNV